MQKYQDVATIIGPPGLIPIRGVNVSVYNHGTQVTTAIYSDNSSTVVANPLTTDSSGRYAFYAANGRYDLTVSGVGIQTTTLTDIELSDPQDLPFINILLPPYNAKGDGITDDTNAINAAISSTANGGSVYFSGTPLISSTITINKKIKLIFDGGLGTTTTDLPPSYLIKKASMTTTAVSITESGVIWEGGGVVGQAGNTGDGITILGNSVTLRDVAAASCGNDGIRIGSDAGGTNQNLWKLENVRAFNNGRRGVYVHDKTGGTPDSDVGISINLTVQSNGEDGLRNGNGDRNIYILTTSEGNGGNGVNFTQGSYCVFFGGDVEGNSSSQILIGAGATSTGLIGVAPAFTLVDNGVSTYSINGGMTLSSDMILSSGNIFLHNAAQIIGRNAANTVYTPIMQYDTSNRVNIGDSTGTIINPIRFFSKGTLNTPDMVLSSSGALTLSGPLGFFGSTAATQQNVSSVVASTSATSNTPFGFATSSQANDLTARVALIQQTLKNYGLSA